MSRLRGTIADRRMSRNSAGIENSASTIRIITASTPPPRTAATAP